MKPYYNDVFAQMAGQDLGCVNFVLHDLGVPLNEYTLMCLAADYKATRPDMPLEDIFTVMDYHPKVFKSVLSSINDYHHIMAGDQGQRVYLGYPKLDKMIRGIRPGQVMGIMARAGVGKTTFATNIIVNLKKRAFPVLFFSLEMPAAEIASRLYTIDRSVWPSKVEDNFSQSINHPDIAKWAREWSHLAIIDEGGLDLETIEAHYFDACNHFDANIPLIVIDYLGLINGKGSSVYERTSYVARNLKNLAKHCECAVIVLVQTSRAGGTGNERVDVNMARDSGQIEEAMDFLLGCYRPDMGADDTGRFMLSILKNRHGRADEIEMNFNRDYLQIEELENE